MVELDKSATESASGQTNPGPEASPSPQPRLELQSGPRLRDAERYDVDELLRFHDRTFVANLYLAIHKRAPSDEELLSALDDLRSGRQTKIEIIEHALAANNGQSSVTVTGLSSPILREIGRWPVVGYWLRMLAGLARLPVLIQHQQQFEAHALGQQQQIVDYLNNVLPVAAGSNDATSEVIGHLSTTIVDAIESVTMLSDSLIDLSARQAELQTSFQREIEQLQAAQAQQGQNLAQTQRKMQSELLAHLKQLQAQQVRLAEAQRQLQADVESVAETQKAHQLALAEGQRTADESRRAIQETQRTAAEAQQEFLIQEQRVIVETQKVVFANLQQQMDELRAEQEGKHTALNAELHKLKSAIEDQKPGASARGARKRISPPKQK